MSLRDHFRPPLSERRGWHGFHNAWATGLAHFLNTRLPAGYFAEPNVNFGIEIDVAALAFDPNASTALADWVPPPPDQQVPVTLSEAVVEIGIFSRTAGPVLAGAIELVSPSNKDRPETREAFVSKCAAYLQEGVSLVIVDVVTERRADLHEALLARLGVAAVGHTSALYATAYRPVERAGAKTLDVWYRPLELGQVLPTLPLWLRGDLCLPVELQAAYDRACSDLRMPPALSLHVP